MYLTDKEGTIWKGRDRGSEVRSRAVEREQIERASRHDARLRAPWKVDDREWR